MKTIFNQNQTVDLLDLNSSREIKIETTGKSNVKDIKRIIKSLQINYQKILNEENQNLSISEAMLYLLPERTGKECQICFEEKEKKNDKIVKCIVCKERTHQNCYGTDLISKKQISNWICLRCRELIKCQKDYNINKCIFCSRVSGLTKKIDTNLWGHITCVNMIPEIHFEDEYKESVDMNQLMNFRKSICNLCEKRVGYICDKGKCKFQMHVTCGISSGCIYKWGLMSKLQGKKKNEKEDEFVELYCPKHTLECLQENNTKISQLISQTTVDESNNDEKLLGKKSGKTIDLEQIISNEEMDYETQVSSFNLVIDKFFEYIEKDCERIKRNQSSILKQESVNKLQSFIKKFVETYKDYHPDLNLLNERIKDM